MSDGNEIRCFAYVTRPFEDVERAVRTNTAHFLSSPTQRAVERASTLQTTLKVSIAGFEIGKDVAIEVLEIDVARHPPHEPTAPAIAIELRWKAASNAALFPSMRARLMIYSLSATETQLDLLGTYAPPGGLLGSAADALVGHRIAEAAIHRFLQDVVERLNAA